MNVDLKPTDLAYAVGRQPNADIKVEVEEHGLFDSEFQLSVERTSSTTFPPII